MPDGVYLVASGRLGVKMAGSGSWTAEIERGEWVGEAGWLLKERRSATVLALRDTRIAVVAGRAPRRRSRRIDPVLARHCAALRAPPAPQQPVRAAPRSAHAYSRSCQTAIKSM